MSQYDYMGGGGLMILCNSDFDFGVTKKNVFLFFPQIFYNKIA